MRITAQGVKHSRYSEFITHIDTALRTMLPIIYVIAFLAVPFNVAITIISLTMNISRLFIYRGDDLQISKLFIELEIELMKVN